MELFDAADPAPSHAADPGVVGAAFSALCKAVVPPGAAPASVAAVAPSALLLAPSVPLLGRLDPAAEVALVVMGDSVASRHAFVPPSVLTAAAALVAAVDAAGPTAPFDSRAGAASSVCDEGWAALVAHSILVTRRELRLRAEVSAADAGPEFDAAQDAELLAWMVQGAYQGVSSSLQRALSLRWVLTIKPPALPGIHPRLKARLCVRGNQERDKALIDSFSPTVSRYTVRMLLILLATMGWEPRTVDVSTAFLQGMPIDRPAPVYVRPAPEAGVAQGIIWLLEK